VLKGQTSGSAAEPGPAEELGSTDAPEPAEEQQGSEAQEAEDAGFRSLGAVELKKAGSGLAGLLGLRGKAAKGRGADENAPEPPEAPREPGNRSSELDGLLEGFQSSMYDQIPSTTSAAQAPDPDDAIELDLPESAPQPVPAAPPPRRAIASPPPAAHAQAREASSGPARGHAQAGAVARGGEGVVLIGAPPLLPPAPLPGVVRSISSGANGLVGTVAYGLRAPRVAQRQREVVGAASSQLTRLKKKEHELVVALGHAARVHEIVPSGGIGVAATPARAAPGDEDAPEPGRSATGGMSTEEQRLIELGRQHENLTVQLGIAQRALDDGEQRLDRMRQREQELRSPPRQDLPDNEVAKRVKEYEVVKTQRVRAERELEVLQEKVTASKQPLRRLKDEIELLRQEIQNTNKRRMESEARKRGAVPTPQRDAEAGGASPAARDEELGRQLMIGMGHSPALRQLVVSTEACRRRIAKWEGVLKEQQVELDRYDEARARKGFILAIGSMVGVLVVLLGVGEIIRRILLAVE
jgi:hypothetical protein